MIRLAAVPRLLYHPAAGYVVLVLSLILTGLAWYFSVEYSKSRAQDRFDFQVEEIESTIRQRMDQYAHILQAGVGLFAASPTVDRQAWREFVGALDLSANYPGTQGLGVSMPIMPDELQGHIDAVRAEGFPDYAVKPPGVRDLYTSIVFLEPFDWRNQRAFGYDMYSEPMRRAAMDQAIVTGRPTISGKVTLVQETGQDVQAGVLMYAPMYASDMPEDSSGNTRQENFTGFVYAVLRGDDLMENILEHIGDDISLEIFDGQASPAALLYRSSEPQDDDDPPFLQSDHTIDIYGQDWVVLVEEQEDPFAIGEYRQSTLVGAFGLLIDFLLFYTIHLVGRQRRQIDRRRYTEELEASYSELQRVNKVLQVANSRLEKSNDDLEGITYAASHDLKSPLRAISALAGFIKEDASDVLPEASARHLDLLQSRADRLATLLDDMIEYARAGSGETEPSSVDFASLTTELTELLENPSGLKMVLDVEVPLVKTQAVPLRQVLMNLIGNAIKHHDRSEGQVIVKARFSDGLIHCVVSDDGPGIPKQFRSLAQEMFKTLQSRDQREGSGMGLPLVIKYIEANGGEFQFLPGNGSERGLSASFTWRAVEQSEQFSQNTETTA